MRRTPAILVMAALAACGHSPKAAPTGGSGAAVADAGVVAADTAPAAPEASASPSRDECALMLGHVFDVAMAARKDPLTPDERAAVRTKMIDANVESCLATSRATYDCAMKATTAAELQACPQ